MDVTDALDAYLTAKVKVGEWQAEFLGKFYKPIVDVMINKAMANASNDQLFDQQKLNASLSPQAQQKMRGV